MSNMTIFRRPIFFFLLILTECRKPSSNDISANIQEVVYDCVRFPAPIFTENLDELLKRLRHSHNSESVVIGRPVIFYSKDDYDFWLKVEFLNPEYRGGGFKEFGSQVAGDLVTQMTNAEEFKKIEVSVVEKRGFIFTYTSKQSTFFAIDSIRQNVRH